MKRKRKYPEPHEQQITSILTRMSIKHDQNGRDHQAERNPVPLYVPTILHRLEPGHDHARDVDEQGPEDEFDEAWKVGMKQSVTGGMIYDDVNRREKEEKKRYGRRKGGTGLHSLDVGDRYEKQNRNRNEANVPTGYLSLAVVVRATGT
jgi:hypothetical protein